MMKWLKIKRINNYPNYWKTYELQFSKLNYPKAIDDNRFIVFDTETTGFDFEKDRVLSIGAVEIQNREIDVSKSLEIYITQDHFNKNTVEIHGIIKNERLETLTEDAAIQLFIEYIGNAILVAHHANFDVTMLNKILKRKGLPKLKNKILDTVTLYRSTRIKSNFITQTNYTLDEIAENYALDVSDRHTAAGDALLTAIIFLRTTAVLIKNKSFSLKQLFKI